VAARLWRQFGGPVTSDELDDVTQQLFYDVYFRLADGYKPRLGAALTHTEQRRSVRAWLCKIASRRVLDLLRSTKDREIESLDAEHATEPGQPVQAPDSDATNRVYELMNKLLDERERIVLRWTYRQWYDPSDGHLHAGPAGAAALAARWKTTVSNIRKIRERALDKLIPALRAEFPTLAVTEPLR
jgi:DNA-directed RNA polymerase specialized sigma subunit